MNISHAVDIKCRITLDAGVGGWTKFFQWIVVIFSRRIGLHKHIYISEIGIGTSVWAQLINATFDYSKSRIFSRESDREKKLTKTWPKADQKLFIFRIESIASLSHQNTSTDGGSFFLLDSLQSVKIQFSLLLIFLLHNLRAVKVKRHRNYR